MEAEVEGSEGTRGLKPQQTWASMEQGALAPAGRDWGLLPTPRPDPGSLQP